MHQAPLECIAGERCEENRQSDQNDETSKTIVGQVNAQFTGRTLDAPD
jgi:hypothetical protein